VKDFESLMALVDSITSSAEQAVIREIDSIQWSFKVFRGNLLDLVRPLKILEEQPEAIKL